MKKTAASLRNFRLSSRWLLVVLVWGCSVHEHDLTPYEKDAQGNTGAAAGAAGSGTGGAAGTSVGGAAGTMQGGAAGTGEMPDGSAGSRDSGTMDSTDVRVDASVSDRSDAPDPSIDAQDTGADGLTPDGSGPIADVTGENAADAPRDVSSEDGSCLPDCPPTACGTISNNCGGALSCGPCQISSTFATVAGVTLTTARSAAASVRIGNYIYVIGGYNNGTYLSTVERATVDMNGNLSNFSDAGVSLVLGRAGHTVLFVNQQLYVIGGLSISYTATVERSSVDGNGNLGSFATVSGVTLTTARSAHGSAVIGHNDYIIGGSNNSALDGLESAAFSTSGDLSTFTPVTGLALATKRFGFATVNIGHWLYVIGGGTDIVADAGTSSAYLTSFERAQFDLTGFTSTFGALSSVSLAIPRYRLAAFAFGTNLYAIGGSNDVSGALASVEQGAINANGDVTGPFTVSSTIALATSRQGAAFLVVPPWLYAIGGYGSSAGDYLNTVERAGVQ